MGSLMTLTKNELTPFRFNAEEITFDPVLIRYVELESRFESTINETIVKIEEGFKAELDDIFNFTENIDGFLPKIFKPLSEFAAKQLSLEGCYDIDTDSFYKNYVKPKFERILEIKQELLQGLERIDEKQEQRNAMRIERRERATQEARETQPVRITQNVYTTSDGRVISRSHVHDPAANEANYQYMKNLLGRTMDVFKNSAERAELFDAVREEIKKELMWICYDMVDSVAYALGENLGIDIRDPRTPEDYEKAATIFKNLKSNVIREEQIDQAVTQVFRLNPQEKGFLAWCVERYGDPDGELGRAAELFHVDVSAAKRKKLEAAVNLKTEADALASKKALEELQAQLSCPAPDLMKKVDDAIVKFDREFRTVDGVEYKTRDEAALARRELDEVNELSKRYPLDNPQLCQDFLNAIAALGLKTSVAEKIVRKATERLSKQKGKLEQFVKESNLSKDAAALLLARHSALARSGLTGMKMFELGNPLSDNLAKAFTVSSDDVALAHINVYNSEKKGGLLISRKGIYSSFIPFCKTKPGLILRIVVAILFVLLLSLTILVSWGGDNPGIFIFYTIVLFVALVALLPIKKKIIRDFTEWNEVSLSFAVNQRILKINEEQDHILPHFNKSKAFFEKLKEAVNTQKDLRE